MAYSSGFSPHPRISYANASPTGAASEAEYLEIGLATVCDPDAVRLALDAALPTGLDVVEVVVAPPGALADLLTGSRWRVELPGMNEEIVADAAERLLAQPTAGVQRLTKNGMRDFDARAAVVALNSGAAELIMTLLHQTPLVRPDDVLTAMRQFSPELIPTAPPVFTRLAQGILDVTTGAIAEPGGRVC